MRVLLMVPPSKDALTLETSNDIAQNMGRFPPMGIMYLASYLKRHTEHEVKLLDADAEEMRVEEIAEVIREFKPDLVGITAFTMTWSTVWEIAVAAKRVDPAVTVCLGGPHVALYYRETLEEVPEVDYCVCGDGEEALLLLLALLENRTLTDFHKMEQMRKIPGIVFRAGDDIHRNDFARMEDLDALPFPDRTQLNIEKYYCILGQEQVGTTMISSRGCPYQCTYCNTPDKTYRKRTADNIVDEMEECVRLGIREIFFFDDLFNIKAKDVIKLCEEILRRGLKVRWAFRGRVNDVTDEMMRKLKEAGCERIQYGIEKADDESFRRVKKTTTIAEVINAVTLTKKYGLLVVGNFLIGTPGETREDIMRIIDFSLRLPLDFAEFSIFIPLAGTEIYEQGLRSGVFPNDVWREYVKKPDKNFCLVWDEILTREELLELHALAHKKFFFRPRIMLKTLLRIRSLSELLRKVKGGLVLLRL